MALVEQIILKSISYLFHFSLIVVCFGLFNLFFYNALKFPYRFHKFIALGFFILGTISAVRAFYVIDPPRFISIVIIIGASIVLLGAGYDFVKQLIQKKKHPFFSSLIVFPSLVGIAINAFTFLPIISNVLRTLALVSFVVFFFLAKKLNSANKAFLAIMLSLVALIFIMITVVQIGFMYHFEKKNIDRGAPIISYAKEVILLERKSLMNSADKIISDKGLQEIILSGDDTKIGEKLSTIVPNGDFVMVLNGENTYSFFSTEGMKPEIFPDWQELKDYVRKEAHGSGILSGESSYPYIFGFSASNGDPPIGLLIGRDISETSIDNKVKEKFGPSVNLSTQPYKHQNYSQKYKISAYPKFEDLLLGDYKGHILVSEDIHGDYYVATGEDLTDFLGGVAGVILFSSNVSEIENFSVAINSIALGIFLAILVFSFALSVKKTVGQLI